MGGEQLNYENKWRKRWDSNPRETFIPTAFRELRLQPLGHSS